MTAVDLVLFLSLTSVIMLACAFNLASCGTVKNCAKSVAASPHLGAHQEIFLDGLFTDLALFDSVCQ